MLNSSSHVLDRVRVADCMHHGILTCEPDTPLAEVAEMMSRHRVHAIAVNGVGDRPALIVSDLDVIAAVAAAEQGYLVRQIAVSEALTAPRDSSVREVARLMAEHGISHVIVLDEANGHPIGMLSTTDILCVYALPVGSRTAE